VAANPPAPLPSAFELAQNYPNPFNPETVIEYQLPRAAEVEITIFNLRGQKVAALVQGQQPAGSHKIIWDGQDESGRRVASGVYLYQLQAGKLVAMKKMLILH
jgi:flagellar hook assembly protein FlgD